MNHIFLERDGQLWYPDSYLQEQIELAYRGGLFNNAKIELHECIIEDQEDSAINETVDRLKSKVAEAYNEAFKNQSVWRKVPEYNNKNII